MMESRGELRLTHDAGAAEFATVFPAPPPSSVTFWYSILPEWAAPFYALSAAEQQKAASNGLSIPGTGTNIFYVYTAQEATLLIAHRATLEPLMKALL